MVIDIYIVEEFKINLIKAQDQDKGFLFDLRKQTMVAHLEKAGVFLSNEEHKDRVNEDYESAHIIFISNKRVGMLKCIENEDKIEILQLQVAPEYQGMGIGKNIIAQLISKAKKESKKLVLKVLKENPARFLYERTGFEIVGEDQYEFHMENNFDT